MNKVDLNKLVPAAENGRCNSTPKGVMVQRPYCPLPKGHKGLHRRGGVSWTNENDPEVKHPLGLEFKGLEHVSLGKRSYKESVFKKRSDPPRNSGKVIEQRRFESYTAVDISELLIDLTFTRKELDLLGRMVSTAIDEFPTSDSPLTWKLYTKITGYKHWAEEEYEKDEDTS